jgi:NAD(P)-dependent dehydrogenase (short-subunit alcohol dehydrogenase family)
MINQPSDRSVLITGASTGIGAACALELDRLGWTVLAGIRDKASADRLGGQASPRLVPVRVDVTDPASIKAAAGAIGEEIGDVGLDGLVNNAGIVVPGPIEAIPLTEIRRQFEVNVLGQIAVTQAMLPLLRAAPGRVIMMGSVSGRVAAPYLGAYAGSKFALEAITDALRTELRQWKILVSILEPGSIETPIWDKVRSTTQRFSEDISPEMLDLYENDLEAMRTLREELTRKAMPVKRVVKAVVHALTARRPRTRYPVGAEAKAASALLPLVSDRLRDWIVRRATGLR